MIQVNPDYIFKFGNNDIKKIPSKFSETPIKIKENKSDFFIFGNSGVGCADLFKDALLDFKIAKAKENSLLSNTPYKQFTKEDVLRILEKAKGLTLLSGSLLKEFYDENHIYDFPLLFATACYNSRGINGGYIDDKTPEIFKGVDKKELFSALDEYSIYFRNKSISANEIIKTQIDGKDFYFKPLENGAECSAFVISDSLENNKNTVIFKVYDYGTDAVSTFAPSGFYGNIGLLREANIAGVRDVPELYFANPIMSHVSRKNYKGCWAIVENANNKELKDGLTLADWLESMGLCHADDRSGNRINGICIDLGFIRPRYNHSLYDFGWGDKCANQIYSGYLQNQTTQDLINTLLEDIVIQYFK